MKKLIILALLLAGCKKNPTEHYNGVTVVNGACIAVFSHAYGMAAVEVPCVAERGAK